MQERDYVWEPELVMSRFARIVDAPRKNEIIFFYFGNLSDHRSRHVADFPEPADAEEKKIVEAGDASSRGAFSVAH